MKSLKQCSLGLLLIALAPLVSKAHEDGEFKVEKKKSYSKSYAVSGSDKIKLDNSFGEMKITTWDKNEVKVDVAITVKANTDEKAQKLLDNIRIEDGKNSSGVYFKTEMNNNRGNWNRDDDDDDDDDKNKRKEKGKHYNNTSMEINYTVYMPANSPLDATNSFGPMIVPDLTGATEISSKFGSLTCGTLSNNKELTVEFGKANIKHISGGEVNIKFSDADISKLSGDVEAKFEFSKGATISLDNSLKSLDIKNSYSTVELELSKDFSGDFDIKTSFGSFKNSTSHNISEEKNDDDDHGPKFDHRYFGKSGSGAAKIKIKSSFGTTKIS
jgi:hypothetical protein